MPAIDLFTLKAGLILFWSVWFSIVFVTNIFEGLKTAGLLPENWKFVSKNYTAIAKATAVYSVPAWLNGLLFLGAILWQGLAVLAFWRASLLTLRASSIHPAAVDTAFAIGIALFAAFIVADEVFRAYNSERDHQLLFSGQLISLLAIHLLPG